jgi:hypothetical protein
MLAMMLKAIGVPKKNQMAMQFLEEILINILVEA